MYQTHFCLIWNSNAIKFNKAIEKLKPNFEVIDIVLSDKHVKSYIECEYKPEKVQCHLPNMIVYDRETFKTIKCVPYSKCI